MNTYLALDLGGTKLMIAEVTADGEILCSKQYKSAYPNQQEGVAGILESLDDYCQSVGFKETPVMIGMGLTGKVDHKKGIWRSLGHIDQDLIPLADILTKKWGCQLCWIMICILPPWLSCFWAAANIVMISSI